MEDLCITEEAWFDELMKEHAEREAKDAVLREQRQKEWAAEELRQQIASAQQQQQWLDEWQLGAEERTKTYLRQKAADAEAAAWRARDLQVRSCPELRKQLRMRGCGHLPTAPGERF